MFFIKGTCQSTIGFNTSGFWFFSISLIFGSIITGWIYGKTCQLGVSAVIYHGLSNAMLEVLSFTEQTLQTQAIEFIVEASIAIALVIFTWSFIKKTNAPIKEHI